MDTYYAGSMMEDEENPFGRPNGLNIDGNKLFFATLSMTIALMFLMRVTSYSSLF